MMGPYLTAFAATDEDNGKRVPVAAGSKLEERSLCQLIRTSRKQLLFVQVSESLSVEVVLRDSQDVLSKVGVAGLGGNNAESKSDDVRSSCDGRHDEPCSVITSELFHVRNLADDEETATMNTMRLNSRGEIQGGIHRVTVT